MPVKEYLYALRPLFAARWIETNQEPPPGELDKLLTMVGNKELLNDIFDLVQKKKSGAELNLAPPIPRINQFIEAESERLDALLPVVPHEHASPEPLNCLFQAVLAEQWEA